MGKSTNTYKNKNTNTYKSKKIKSKTYKGKGKKLLKKMMTTESELDDVNSVLDNSDSVLDDVDLLEENILMAVGGDNIVRPSDNIVRPSELDKNLFGYKEPVDTQGPIGKFIDSVEDSIDDVKEVAENVVSVGKVAFLKKLSDVAGYEGKTSDEVMNEIKNDAESIEKINNYFKSKEGEETLEDIQDLSNTATGVIAKSFEKIPETLTDSMEKMGDAGLKITKGLATEVPIVAPIIGASDAVKGTEDAIIASADALKKVANLTGDTAEEIKKPIEDIKEKIDEVSSEIENTQQLSQSQMDESKMNDESQMDESKIKINEKNIQLGGSDMTKFYNLLQNGGKKLRKRINNTRHAFKNISKNITKKNK